MLVLTRKQGQSIRIGKDIKIHILPTDNMKQVKIGIEAPKDTLILRTELDVKKKLMSTGYPDE